MTERNINELWSRILTEIKKKQHNNVMQICLLEAKYSIGDIDEHKYKIKSNELNKIMLEITKIKKDLINTAAAFSKRSDGKKQTIPRFLKILMKEHKKCKIRVKMEEEPLKSLYNDLQLAYKVIASSLYGNCGAQIALDDNNSESLTENNTGD